MRQILFNAKRVDNGEWVEGSYHFSKDRSNHYIISLEKFNERPNVNGVAGLDEMSLFKTEVNIVDQSTVCQFTGKPDKNGKKLFWKNIVEVTNKGAYNGIKVIEWDDALLCYVLVWADSYSEWKGTQYGTTYLKLSSGIKCNYVGNVFDNPELLK